MVYIKQRWSASFQSIPPSLIIEESYLQTFLHTLFLAIGHSNAATATVLQYLAPVMIVIYVSIRYHKMPSFFEFAAVLCALLGTFLLATHGNVKSLSISLLALFWGLLSAVALAFYTVFPKNLLQKYDTILLIAWGMLIGGICTNFVAPFWHLEGTFNFVSIGCILFVIFFGAMLPYLTFLYGVKYIGPTKSSLLASVEPLSSTAASVLWLHTHLESIDYIGIACIIATVFLLSIQPKPKIKEQKSIQSGPPA
ncbi:hypothetical protein B5G26_15735 [Anaerotignum lactatifermentans]|uniref:EamA domain-containing protein n=1 Tax=Anaerotignum lactatifermentans TaxID=160404 RepID=A0A1Y3TXT1_9FIRM|nr:DMT family transporter [Anaerotignum lactatifermentans]OUN39039.1 hypothetical protein B5G26_15735 [Anaerotignum lactatifermentans]